MILIFYPMVLKLRSGDVFKMVVANTQYMAFAEQPFKFANAR